MSSTSLPEIPLAPLSRPGVPEPRLGERASFPELEWRAFLGHAAISPASAAVREAVRACVEDTMRGGAAAFLPWELQRRRLRRGLEQWLGAQEGEVALTSGTTRGLTDLALALPLREGDVIVTYAGEFPANVTPWQLAAQARGARVELLPAPEPTRADASERVLEDLRAALRAGARYLAVSAVQFQTGFAMPIAELARLCHEFDALCFVDAIQALGGQPCDVESWGIDGLAGGAHKWMLGLEGAGFLYVRSEVRARLRPLTAGWLSHEEGESFLFEGAGRLRYDRPLKPTARVFEGSSINAVGCAALEAGFDVCRTVGAANIAAHVQGYHDRIEPEWQARGFRSLRAVDSAGRSNILSFALPEGLALPELARELRARRIMVSTPDGYVRLAPHFANPHSEIDHVVDALDESLAALKR